MEAWRVFVEANLYLKKPEKKDEEETNVCDSRDNDDLSTKRTKFAMLVYINRRGCVSENAETVTLHKKMCVEIQPKEYLIT